MQLIVRWAALICVVVQCHGFSLLGPFESWQTPALGYNPLGTDVGAPKNLDEEYRHNIPVLTYGFDRSFMDFFGYPGVLAVDAAMEILNDLPPASELKIGDFYWDTRRINPSAQAMQLIDLKSVALALMVEQLGLANPVRYMWTLRDRKTFDGTWSATNYLVVQRNFDPETLRASSYVNRVRLSYTVQEFANPWFADAVESGPIDPTYGFPAPVAGTFGLYSDALDTGIFYIALSEDDAGGLRYLLNPPNINAESLPPDVQVAIDGGTFVNEALRPGVNKIFFHKITTQWAPPSTWSMEVRFTDRFYDDNMVLREQQVKRVISRPDIIFSAADLGTYAGSVYPPATHRTAPRFRNTNWLGGELTPAGPGTIEPGTTITFGKRGRDFINVFPGSTGEPYGHALSTPGEWGWFGGSPAAPIVFSRRENGVHSELAITRTPGGLVLTLLGYPEAPYQLQQSFDLTNWTTMGVLRGSSSTNISTAGRGQKWFFRAVSAPE